jgi:hypothetical protein
MMTMMIMMMVMAMLYSRNCESYKALLQLHAV